MRNTQDGVSVAQTAEGSLNEVTSILQRMRDLSVQASNSGATDSDAAAAANKEMSQLNAELDRIGSTTAFGKQKLLDGTFGATKTTAATAIAPTDANASPAGAVPQLPAAATTAGTPWTFKLTEVAGSTNKPDGTALGAGITVSVDAVATDASPQDLAKAVNSAISTALKQNGYQGNEVTLSAKVDSQNNTTFSMSGAGDFALTDTTGVLTSPTVVAAGTNLMTGGLGITAAGGGVGGTLATTDLSATTGNKGSFQVGANANQKINIQIGAVNSEALGTASLDLTSDPDAAITTIDKALQSVSDSRASLGAYQNRFDHTINNLNVAVENLSASESRIRDTDMAQEMVSYTRAQILTQAGTSMLSQANQSAQNVLSLLR